MYLDKTHKKILALLQEDARISNAAIGRAVNLSRPAVQERISAMEKAGVIQGYCATISENIGLVHALIFIQIAERPCDKALLWLKDLEGVTSVLSLAGDIDAVVSIALPSMDDLSSLNDKIGSSPLISSAKSNIILRHYKASK